MAQKWPSFPSIFLWWKSKETLADPFIRTLISLMMVGRHKDFPWWYFHISWLEFKHLSLWEQGWWWRQRFLDHSIQPPSALLTTATICMDILFNLFNFYILGILYVKSFSFGQQIVEWPLISFCRSLHFEYSDHIQCNRYLYYAPLITYQALNLN